MDSVSMNPYEQQLYTVFKNFDVDNEEALDKSAVLELCNALQLEDRGADLVNTLFEHRTDRVTFTQFRNGLLSLLSTSDRSPPSAAVPVPSDEDSSGREVDPKFVFGSKKYGRRSRPQRATAAPTASPRAASGSRLDSDDRRNRTSQRMRCKRSASAMENRDLNATADDDDDGVLGEFDHDRRIDRDQALALCRGLRMDGIDAGLVERIFEDSHGDETTVGEFFDRLNASLTTSIESSREPGAASDLHDDDAADEDAGIASELVVDAWERAGVPRPRRLLFDLGFGAAVVRPPDLERALDDEAAALAEPLDERRDSRPTLLAAALALGRLRLARARRRADVAAAERDKLRANVVEANARARMLALDVDESHARMEAALAADLRRAEARHADAERRACDEVAAERERAAALRARLDAEVARRAEAEARARSEVEAERERAGRAEERATAAEARAAAAQRETARLAEEARRAQAEADAAAEGAGGGAAPELRARLEELTAEAQRLRDRNDELCALLEAAARRPAPETTACGDLSAELSALLAPDAVEESDSSPVSIDQKMTDASETMRRFQNIFESIQTIDFGESEGCTSCARVKDVVSELQRELSTRLTTSSTSTAVDGRSDAATETAPAREHDDKYKDLIRELESSLEQMRDEYERCEEYWARKLEDERAAHDDERRAGDERLAELAARVADYERSFARARPPLAPIEERAALEAQAADCERELARALERLRARDDELRRLRARLAVLGASAAARGAGARDAAALRARAARAEGAARRLAARLHAADLLVKDLYVENCQLAHRRAT